MKLIYIITYYSDAFTAGFLATLFKKNRALVDSELTLSVAADALQIASAAGAFVCQKEGAISSQPNDRELHKFIETMHSISKQ